MTIWVATYNTESTDRGVVGFWTTKPSAKELLAYFKENFPSEFEDGHRTIYWDVVGLTHING